ncbi:MAG TPA: hypothetical protein VGE07_01425 [Herpetosiphonaceae bacterium]
MTNPERAVAVTLSRSELVLIAALLRARSMVGVEPLSGSEEQQALELLQAERSLRARNAATVTEEGKLLVVRDLLAAVGTCIYPERSLFVYHTRTDGVALQAFGHQREELSIFHAVLNPELHNIVQVPDASGLIRLAFQICSVADDLASAGLEVDLDRATLAGARQQAEQGETAAAAATLAQAGAAPAAAEALAAMLSREYTTSVFVTVAYQDGQAAGREYTLLQSGGAALLMTQADQSSERYQLRGIDRDGLLGLLLQSMNPLVPQPQ